MRYQLLPPLSESEFRDLKADVAAHGVTYPVLLDEDGEVLDGHHRVQAWDELTREGVRLADYPTKTVKGLSEQEKVERVLALNLHRRHLTRDQRDGLIVDLRKRGMSERQIAEAIPGTSQPTVHRVLSGDSGESPEVVTGKDGKQYRATRPRPEATPEESLDGEPEPADVGDEPATFERRVEQAIQEAVESHRDDVENALLIREINERNRPEGFDLAEEKRRISVTGAFYRAIQTLDGELPPPADVLAMVPEWRQTELAHIRPALVYLAALEALLVGDPA